MKGREYNYPIVTPGKGRGKSILERIARRAMKERGFLPDFSRTALDELENLQRVDWRKEAFKKDLRHLLWVSIDNDDSLDLDQLTVAVGTGGSLYGISQETLNLKRPEIFAFTDTGCPEI